LISFNFTRRAAYILGIGSTHRSQKFEDPVEGEEKLVAKFKKLYDDLTQAFRQLEDELR